MDKLIKLLFVVFILFFNANNINAETDEFDLPPCIVVTHCVKENWEVKDIDQSFQKIETAISNTPRTTIVEKSPYYIHAEAKTRWLKYTDDLLIKAFPNKGIIQVRSESRVGVGDNGVNKKRINELAYRLITNQVE